MASRRLWLWVIILGLISAAFILQLPYQGTIFIARRFLQHKYNISIRYKKCNGGFVNGISLDSFSVSYKNGIIFQSSILNSDVKFKDFFFSKSKNVSPYNIFIKNPVLSVNASCLSKSSKPILSLLPDLRVFVSGGRLILKGVAPAQLANLSGYADIREGKLSLHFRNSNYKAGINGNFDTARNKGIFKIAGVNINIFSIYHYPVIINGNIISTSQGLKIEKGLVSLKGFNLRINGVIRKGKQLNLRFKPAAGKNFTIFLKGRLNKPQIICHYRGIDTVFRAGNVSYNSNKLQIQGIRGMCHLLNSGSFNMDGSLTLSANGIGLENINLAHIVHINGTLSKRGHFNNMELSIEKPAGSDFNNLLPQSINSLLFSHKITANISIYGMADNLQAGGIIKIFPYSIIIKCRYRHSRFSFCSIGKGPVSFSGSINNLRNKPTVKIAGYIHKMDILKLVNIFQKGLNLEWKGIVDGTFNISGMLQNPLIRAKLEVNNAKIGHLMFDTAYIDLKETNSILDFQHSMVYYKGVPAELTGYIDMKTKGGFDNISIIPTAKSFIWKGVNILRDTGNKVVVFGQDINKDVSVFFQSPLTNDADSNKKPQIELQYKLLDGKDLLMRMKGDEGLLGIEHKIKF